MWLRLSQLCSLLRWWEHNYSPDFIYFRKFTFWFQEIRNHSLGLKFNMENNFHWPLFLHPQELDKIVAYELKTGGVLLHPIFGGGKEKDKYVYCSEMMLQTLLYEISLRVTCVCSEAHTGRRRGLSGGHRPWQHPHHSFHHCCTWWL